jgi:hypothetical protein
MLKYELSQVQFDELLSLKFWLVEKAWLREREPNNIADITKAHRTILFVFEKLDRLQVPFWVQNCVLNLQDDWRKLSAANLAIYLQKFNITIQTL